MEANIELVRRMYRAFMEGRIGEVLDNCAETISWECVGDPAYVPHAGTFSGREGVAQFFERLAGVYEFQLFSPDDFHAAGDRVFCFGHADATAKSTGRPINNQWLHSFTVRNGKVTEFLEFSDTARIAAGAGKLRPAA